MSPVLRCCCGADGWRLVLLQKDVGIAVEQSRFGILEVILQLCLVAQLGIQQNTVYAT